jgi:hypothetical protein
MATIFNLPFADVGSGIKPPDGAQLFFYEAGTDTPKNTFTTSTANVANDNPVIASSTGVFPVIYLTGDYWVTLKDKNNVQKWAGVSVSEKTVRQAVSIADLKTKNLDAGDSANTLGYYSAGDGGNAPYLCKTASQATTDGDVIDGYGNHTLNNGNVVILQPINTIINARSFGETGTNDDASVGALINRGLLDANVTKAILDCSLNAAVTCNPINGSKLKISGNLTGTGSLSIVNTLGNSTTFTAITRGDNVINVADASDFSVNDWVQVVAQIEQENYTNDRFLNLAFVCKITEISGLALSLDRKIEYKTAAGNVFLVPDVSVEFDLDQSNASFFVNDCPVVTGKSLISGSRGLSAGSQLLSVLRAGFIDVNTSLQKVQADLCSVYENISSGTIKVVSTESGGVLGSKVIRGNAWQAIDFHGNFQSSQTADAVVYAARNCYAKHISDGAGVYLRKTGNVSGNRSEAVVWAESDGVHLHGQMTNSDDQCAEFISCGRNSILSGSFARVDDKPTTEGAVNIKGFCDGVVLDIKAFSEDGRAIKLEYLNGMQNIRLMDSCYGYSGNNQALSMRDAPAAHDTKSTIKGTYKSVGSACVGINEHSNNVNMDVTVDLESATLGINANGLTPEISAKAINAPNSTVRIVNIANGVDDWKLGAVSGLGRVTFNGTSATNSFSFLKLGGVLCEVFNAPDNKGWVRSGFGFMGSLPDDAEGNYQEGEFVFDESINAPGGGKIQLGWRYRAGTGWQDMFCTNS